MIDLIPLAVQRVDPRKAIVEQFNKQPWDPETWRGIIVVAAGILVLVVILHFLLHYEKRGTTPALTRDAHKLFREILAQLPFSGSQRELLRRIARELQLQSPAVMLLSPEHLIHFSKRWLSTPSAAPHLTRELDLIADVLFSSAEVVTPCGTSE